MAFSPYLSVSPWQQWTCKQKFQHSLDNYGILPLSCLLSTKKASYRPWSFCLNYVTDSEHLIWVYTKYINLKNFIKIMIINSWTNLYIVIAGRGSSIGSVSAWPTSGPESIPTSGTFFLWDLVMKTFLRPFSLFRWFKKSSCQLLAKECALSTGKLPRRLAQEQCG